MGRPKSNIVRPLCAHCRLRRVTRACQRLCSRACANAVRARPLVDRFLESYTSGAPDACWLWTGTIGRGGYGVICDDEWKQRPAHRIAYERAHGPIPHGLNVCHRCDNPPCVNPAHLFAGTSADNTADMIRKGRSRVVGQRGERNPAAKLTAADVRAIRGLYPRMTQTAIAKRYGLDQTTVSDIVRRDRWPHIR